MNRNRDPDGDVEMTIPQPIYEFVQAPRLTGWDQATLINWLRAREQYEEKLSARCSVSGENYESLVTPITNSMDPRVLEKLARYVLKLPVDEVDDATLKKAIEERCSSLKNGYIPDLDRLFKSQLKMDLKEADTEARILNYFVLFDKIVEENGLKKMLGSGRAKEAGYEERMALRCKYLIANVAPEILRVEIERMAMAKPAIKKNDLELFDTLVERAREQQHYHMLSQELKSSDKMRSKNTEKDQANSKTSKKDDHGARRQGREPNGGSKAESERKSGRKEDRTRMPPRDGCLLCGKAHWVVDCPDATEEQKREALDRVNKMKGKHVNAKKAMSRPACGERSAIVNSVLEVPFRADTGADCNVLARRVVHELKELNCDIEVTKMSTAIEVEVADGRTVLCDEQCQVDVELVTAAGPVRLRNLSCVVLESESDELLLGNETLKTLGINVDQLLEQLAARNEFDKDEDDFEDGDIIGVSEENDVLQRVNGMLEDAKKAGFPLEHFDQLRSVLMDSMELWRTKLGADPPAKLEPLRVVLKEGAVPHRTKPRQYSPVKTEFLQMYAKQLEQFGYVTRNNQSRWACAAIPVRKKGEKEDYRIATDYRPTNSQTIPIAGSMPNLLVVIAKVKGATYFACFDLFKGFWQLLLHEDSREIFSFITHDTVYTPLRVPQGATDSPIHFQNQMQEVLRDMLYENVLVWVDDIVVFAKSAEEFIMVLQKFFARLNGYGLKLNANKSCLFAREIKWCGRIIDGDGVRHDPDRVAALRSLPLPTTAADLQKLLCAANWLRESIVNFAQLVETLQSKLEAAFAGHSRKQRYAEGLLLTWTSAEQQQYRTFLDGLAQTSKLSFPDDDATVCLCTDASDKGWSLVVTQVGAWRDANTITDQPHELLLCKGGTFKGAQLHWSIAEKEAFPIVKAAKDLEYLLHRVNGFKLFCDHANLIQIFCPSKEIRKHVRGKLQRWSLMLQDYRYQIEHVKGTENVWADLVSRWLVPTPEVALVVKAVRTRSASSISRLRPLQDEAFVWPTIDHIRDAQERFRRFAPTVHALDDGLILVEGKVWVPTQAKELLTRIMIIAHCGLNAHRGADTMMRQLAEKYHVNKLKDTVKEFVGDCLLCKHVKGGMVIQRPWSEPRAPAARNEALHFDFLYMGDTYGTTRYVLVLKDELTHYCELVACDSPTSLVTATAILDWAKRFGLPSMWISDNGSHFKNRLLEDLRERMKALHTFVPVYTPWVNGTVERINRDILQVMRVLLLEYQLDTKSWEFLLPLVQFNLNQTPVRSLGGKAPVELFTGLVTSKPLDSVSLPQSNGKAKLMTIDLEVVDEELEQLRESLAEMHVEVKDRKEKTRLYQRMAKNGKLENFSVGDYVLWSRVDERLRGNKLMVRWVGPYRVVEALDYSFKIESILTKDVVEVHGSRLKFYDDATLDVTEEIIEHVSKQGIVTGVEEIKGHRYNEVTKQWELLISWRGLQDIEDSWEPLSDLQRDIPLLVEEYIETQGARDLRAQLGDA